MCPKESINIKANKSKDSNAILDAIFMSAPAFTNIDCD